MSLIVIEANGRQLAFQATDLAYFEHTTLNQATLAIKTTEGTQTIYQGSLTKETYLEICKLIGGALRGEPAENDLMDKETG